MTPQSHHGQTPSLDIAAPGPEGNRLISWHAAGMEQVDGSDDWLEPALASRLANMPYTKRRLEARLGRWTAKTTIARSLGIAPHPANLRRIAIRNAADGAPEVDIDGQPLDAVIAMTDRADWAVCALLPGNSRVGCDLELVEPRSEVFVRDYFTPSERELVADRDHPEETANLIWSAKESVLKVLRTGLRRDTRSVSVSLEASGSAAWSRLSVTTDDGREFPGWWIRFGEFVLTVATELPTPPPVCLEQPEPLQQAQPGHSWMADPYTPM